MELKTAIENALIEMRNTHRDMVAERRCPCEDPHSQETCPMDRAITDLEDALSN